MTREEFDALIGVVDAMIREKVASTPPHSSSDGGLSEYIRTEEMKSDFVKKFCQSRSTP